MKRKDWLKVAEVLELAFEVMGELPRVNWSGYRKWMDYQKDWRKAGYWD